MRGPPGRRRLTPSRTWFLRPWTNRTVARVAELTSLRRRSVSGSSGLRSGVTTPPRSGRERVASRRPLRRQVAAALDIGLDAQPRRLERVAALAVGEPLELVRRQRGVARRRVVRPDRRDLAVGTELVPLRPADVLVHAGLEVRPLDAELLAVADDPVDRPARAHALHEPDPQVGD